MSKVASANQAISAFTHGSTYSPATFKFRLAIWIARSQCLFQIVQDEYLLALFKMLFVQVEIPHPTTVSRDIHFMGMLAST